MSIKSVTSSNHLILCCSLHLQISIFPTIRVFSNESVLHIRWPKYCSFSITLSNEYSGLISFRIDWLDLPTVQGTLRSLIQHHSSKGSILRHSAFFKVQLSHLYMTTGKTIALTIQTFVGKMMSLLFNMLSGFLIAVLAHKCQQGPATVTTPNARHWQPDLAPSFQSWVFWSQCLLPARVGEGQGCKAYAATHEAFSHSWSKPRNTKCPLGMNGLYVTVRGVCNWKC